MPQVAAADHIGSVVGIEGFAAVNMTFLVEMVVDRSVDRSKIL